MKKLLLMLTDKREYDYLQNKIDYLKRLQTVRKRIESGNSMFVDNTPNSY